MFRLFVRASKTIFCGFCNLAGLHMFRIRFLYHVKTKVSNLYLTNLALFYAPYSATTFSVHEWNWDNESNKSTTVYLVTFLDLELPNLCTVVACKLKSFSIRIAQCKLFTVVTESYDWNETKQQKKKCFQSMQFKIATCLTIF